MHRISLDSETDFDGWRRAARALALNDISPAEVTWTVGGSEAVATEPLDTSADTFSVAAKFVERAQAAILHRDVNRFDLLYRLLWRLRSHHDLLNVADDPEVARVTEMAKAVHRDQQRMQTLVRFREVGREQKSHFVAWFEPEHHIVAATAPFFASRYADMPWSILTPDVCAHWDGHAVAIPQGSRAPKHQPRTGWKKSGAATVHPSSIRRGCG